MPVASQETPIIAHPFITSDYLPHLPFHLLRHCSDVDTALYAHNELCLFAEWIFDEQITPPQEVYIHQLCGLVQCYVAPDDNSDITSILLLIEQLLDQWLGELERMDSEVDSLEGQYDEVKIYPINTSHHLLALCGNCHTDVGSDTLCPSTFAVVPPSGLENIDVSGCEHRKTNHQYFSMDFSNNIGAEFNSNVFFDDSTGESETLGQLHNEDVKQESVMHELSGVLPSVLIYPMNTLHNLLVLCGNCHTDVIADTVCQPVMVPPPITVLKYTAQHPEAQVESEIEYFMQELLGTHTSVQIYPTDTETHNSLAHCSYNHTYVSPDIMCNISPTVFQETPAQLCLAGEEKQLEYHPPCECVTVCTDTNCPTLLYLTDTHTVVQPLAAQCGPSHTYAISDTPLPTIFDAGIAGLWVETEEEKYAADPRNWLRAPSGKWLLLECPPPPYVPRARKHTCKNRVVGRPDCKESNGCQMCKGVRHAHIHAHSRELQAHECYHTHNKMLHALAKYTYARCMKP